MFKDEIKILKSALGSLETSLKSLLKVNNDQEQYSRRECVEIPGVPERVGESTIHLVKEVGRALGVEATDNDISVSTSPLVKSLQEQETCRPVAYHC